MIEHFGQAGHFIASRWCRFHLHTHVHGKHCVSTVGEYFPRPAEDKMETVGVDRFYETMVFPLCADGTVDYGNTIDFAAYNTRDEANAGHKEMVRKFSQPKEEDNGPDPIVVHGGASRPGKAAWLRDQNPER